MKTHGGIQQYKCSEKLLLKITYLAKLPGRHHWCHLFKTLYGSFTASQSFYCIYFQIFIELQEDKDERAFKRSLSSLAQGKMNYIFVIPDTCLCSQSLHSLVEEITKSQWAISFHASVTLLLLKLSLNLSGCKSTIYSQNGMGQLSVFKHHETPGLRCSGCSDASQLKLTPPLRALDFAL